MVDAGSPSIRLEPSDIAGPGKLQCVQVCTFDQCVFNLPAKPTTLLLLRLSTFRGLALGRGCGGKSHVAGHAPLKGRQASGEFATARAKIYPRALNHALPLAVCRFLCDRQMSEGTCHMPDDLQELGS